MKKLTKTDKRQFLNALRDAVVEKDIENAYRAIIQKCYESTFTSPYGCDGYLEPDQDNLLAGNDTSLRLLIEVKNGKNFTNGDRIKLLCQTIYYLKKFEQDAKPLPNVILGGDENELFLVYAPKLYRYLDEDYDWSIAPSEAYKNEKLYRQLLNDDNIRDTYIFAINEQFSFDEVIEAINALRDLGEFKKLKVDEANLRKVFDEFVRLVFGDNQWLTGIKKLGATETVSIFIQSILGKEDIYLHPNKPNILVNVKKEVRIRGAAYNAFFSRYDRQYTVKEIDTITAVADQLIKEVERRFHGDFWTPTIWADEAIKMITRDLGEDWREKYYVWDPAAGTKNLTRDYEFAHLFSSTLHQSEIDMSTQYNKNAVCFQYDFLNDDIDVNPNSDPRDLKMPRELFEALKANKPFIFYANPPYGQASNQNTSNKSDIAENKIGSLMREVGYGHASSELYTQFIFRVQKLARDFQLKHIFFFFFFFNKGFLISPAFGKFTDDLLSQFKFNDGFMMNAGEFQGTSSNWGIIFSNFENRQVVDKQQTHFCFDVKHTEAEGIVSIKNKTLRRVNKESTILNWLLETRTLIDKHGTSQKMPRINGGFKLPKGSQKSISIENDFLGFMEFHGCAVQNSDKYVHLNSTYSNDYGHGYTVNSKNFERVCVTFSCRKSILPDASWINDKDVFRRPSDKLQNSPQWLDFVYDCVVFSLFHKSSYQTSLRDFEYDGELYDVKNEWFFMSRPEIIQLAEKYELNDTVFDARNSSERFVYKYLHQENEKKISLSPEAKELLEAGEEFIRACFPRRFMTSQEHPEWHLLTWDAGYYQSYKIYTINKDNDAISQAYKQLDKARARLETKIRQIVYQDGILNK